MYRTFETPHPVSLYVEIAKGDITVHTAETAQTSVTVEGREAEDTVVEQRGDQVVVIASKPDRGGLFSFGHDLTVQVSLPEGSDLATRTGSADLAATGRYGSARVKSGSGDVRLDVLTGGCLVQIGSGDVSVGEIAGDFDLKSGSGDVEVGRARATTRIATGSGDVVVDVAEDAVEAATGSGDLRVREAHGDVSLKTASGDLFVDLIHRGRMSATNVSGDVRVAIPSGTPVWTEASSMTGEVTSALESLGQPGEGQDHVEVRARTVTGDILLEHR